MQATDIVQGVLRWIHIIAGIAWIGHLYFFNFVNGPFAATMDGDTKKKVVPELMPRALFWFRWGAAYTWVTGVLLLLLVFYHGGLMIDPATGSIPLSAYFGLGVVLLAPIVYDLMCKLLKGDIKKIAVVGFIITTGLIAMMAECWNYNYRAYVVMTGGMFGTIMAFNVWMRIWPSQQKIITGIKTGTPAAADIVALAGARSRHNTYMSVPLIWAMINQHTTFAATHWGVFVGVIALGWLMVNLLYKKSAQVKGF